MVRGLLGSPCFALVVPMSHRLQRFIRTWVLIAILGLFGPVIFVLILTHRRARRHLFVPFAHWLGSKWGVVTEEYRQWQP